MSFFKAILNQSLPPPLGEEAERSEVGGGIAENIPFYSVFSTIFTPSVAFGDSSPLKGEPRAFVYKIYACSLKQIIPLSTFMLSTMAMDSRR